MPSILKEPIQVFADEVGSLLAQIDNSNYSACIRITDNYTVFFMISGSEDLVFVSEVLNGALKDIAGTITSFASTEEEIEAFNQKFKDSLQKILEGVKSASTPLVYEGLKEFRCSASNLQFAFWHTKQSKSSPLGLPASFRIG